MSSLLQTLFGEIPDAAPFHNLQVGIDAESIPECAELLSTLPGRALLESRFTEQERSYIGDDPERFAGRWALKEAVSKALGTGFRGIRPIDIEILRESGGRPYLAPAGSVQWPNDGHRWMWAISVSRAGDAAIAMAVAFVSEPGTCRGED